MSSDFKLVNITDSVLDDITSELTLPVMQGAESTNYQQFNAISATTAQMQFNVQVPSQENAVNRHAQIQTDVILKVDMAGGTNAGY